MQVSSNDNFFHAQSFAHREQSQRCDKSDQDIMRVSPLTMATNGTSSPSMAGSEPSGAGSTSGSNHVNEGQSTEEESGKQPIAFLLRCPECRFETLSIDRLKSHFPCVLRVSPVKFFIFRCDICKSYSTNRDLMEEHKQLHHKQASEVTLTEISDQVEQVSTQPATENRLSSSLSSQLSCPLCRVVCPTPREIGIHFENFHGKNNVFPGNKLLFPFIGNQNVFAPPPPGIAPNQTLMCFLCNLGFADNESLFQHLTTHKDFMVALLSMSSMSKLPPFNNTDESSNPEMEYSTPVKDLPNLTAGNNFHPSIATTSVTLNGNNTAVSSPNAPTMSPSSTLPCASRGQLASNMFLSAVASSGSFPPTTVPNLANLQPLTNQSVAAMAATLASVAPAADNGRGSILPRNQPSPLHNTIRKTKSDMKVINRFLASKGEMRDVCQMKVDELNAHLQDFIKNARKKDNNDYEPESLKAFIHSLERHLKNNDYPHSVLRDNIFSETRQVLQNRLQCLRQSSRTTGPVGGGGGARGFQNSVARQTYADLVSLGTLGHSTPQALINTLFIILKKYFGVKGPGRHRMLTWGQLNVVTVPIHGEVLQFEGGADSNGVRQHTRAAGINFPVDVIETYQIYSNLRPVGCRRPADPFYLMIDPGWERGGPWFQPLPLSMSSVQRIPRALTNRLSGGAGEAGPFLGSSPNSGTSPSGNSGGQYEGGPPALAPANTSFDSELPSMVPRMGSNVGKDSPTSSPPNDEVFEFKLPAVAAEEPSD